MACFASIKAQIIIQPTTLPDVGDVLNYVELAEIQDTTSYRTTGQNLQWTFDSFGIGGTTQESHDDISGTALGDSFPNANMIVNIALFETAAIRSDSTIELIGLIPGNLGGFGIETSATFTEPFLYKKTPLQYGDSFDDSFDFTIQFSASLIPGLDSLEIPIPGATLDSIRVVTTLFKSEEVTAWGQLHVLDNMMDVLKVKQVDMNDTRIEVGLGIFGNTIWLDATDLIGDPGFNFNQSSVTYKFLSADSKESIIEFNETRIQDTSGASTLLVSGRLSADLISATKQTQLNKNAFTIYPNPAVHSINIQSKTQLNAPARILILNVNGKLVKHLSDFRFNEAIDVKGITPGHYFIHIQTKDGSWVNKISIVK